LRKIKKYAIICGKIKYSAYFLLKIMNIYKYRRKKMKEKLIELIEKEYLRDDIPKFKAGDTVKIYYKVKEGNKERIQMFEGVVIRISGGQIAKNITVRKVSYGIGVERIIPINSPYIDKIEVKKVGKVRRARLYYLRERFGKAARIKEIRN